MDKMQTLSIKEKLSFSATAMGKNLVYFLVATYYMFYLTQVQGLSGFVVGAFFAATRIFDAINDPIMGTIVDNTRSRFGKFRPWILIGTIMNTLVLILMFFPIQNLNIVLKYIFYLSLYLFWGITYTLMDVPYWSMIPAIATNAADKNSVSSLTQIAAGIGMILAVVVMPMVFTSFGSSVEPVAYLYPSIIIGVCFILLTIFTVFVVREKTVIKYQKIRLKEMFKLLFKNDQLLAYNIIMLFILTASTLIMTFATYFFSFVIGDYTLSLFSVFFIIAGVSQAGGMLSYPFIAKKINMNKMFYFAGFSSIFGLVLFSLLTASPLKDNIVFLSAIGVITLFGFGWLMVISVVMLADIVDYGEKKMGARTESIIFSMKTLVQKFAAALASLIVGVAVDLAKIGDKDPATFQMSFSSDIIIRVVMFALPVLFILAGLLFYKFTYKLGRKINQDDNLQIPIEK